MKLKVAKFRSRRARKIAKAIMGGASPVGILANQQQVGALLNAYTTAKSVINSQAQFSFQPNYLWVGKTFRITVAGGISNIITTPGTVTMQVMIGNVIAFTTGPVQLNASAHTLAPFWLDILLTCRTVGGSASFMGMGKLQGIPFTMTALQVDIINTGSVIPAPTTSPSVGSTFDATASELFDFWVGFSINNSGNGVQIQHYLVEDF